MKLHVAVALLGASLIFLSCAKKREEPSRRNVPQYTIGQFYKNKQITGGTFSPDESHLLVSSDESGIYNLYEINISDTQERQVTRSTVESFSAIDYVPGTNAMLYTADKGGMRSTISIC